MALGNGIEVASMTAGGGEVSLGHALFLIGFLVSVLGSVVVGIVVFRRRHDALSRAAALLLALALPLGIGIGILGSAIAPAERRRVLGRHQPPDRDRLGPARPVALGPAAAQLGEFAAA